MFAISVSLRRSFSRGTPRILVYKPQEEQLQHYLFVSGQQSSFSSTTSLNNNSNNQKSETNVGFLGLGNMGLPMALNLQKSSTATTSSLLAFDVNQAARNRATEQGLPVATSLEQIATSSSTIVTMLPGDAAVNQVLEVVLHERSSNNSLPLTIVDSSTVSPTTSRYWQERFAQDGHFLVDAPVSGGVKGAQQASLTFMVGCHEDDLHKVQSILECMGQSVISCGGPGAGAVVKLCNNLALACQMVGICEAMNLGDALGVDPRTLAKVMNMSTAKSWSCEVNNPHPAVAGLTGSPASQDYRGGFSTKLMLKDLGLAVAAGKEANVALPLGSITRELYHMADLRGLGDRDFGVMLQILRGSGAEEEAL